MFTLLYRRILAIAWLLLFTIGCREAAEIQQKTEPTGSSPAGEPAISSVEHSDATIAQINQNEIAEADDRRAFINRMRPAVDKFCGGCHAPPPPESSTVGDWVAEVDQMFQFYHDSQRTDLQVPDRNQVLKFFQSQAPQHHELTKGIIGYPPSPIPFQVLTVARQGNRPPGITNIKWMDLGLRASSALVYCDIGTGAVMAHWPGEADHPTVRLSTVLQPVHVEPCDLDRDNIIDLIVADIGEFTANDSDLGQIVWLHRTGEPTRDGQEENDFQEFKKTVLLDGLSRIADVRPGDFDHDGDVDLLVAEFGWRATGQIFLMLNDGQMKNGVPQFTIRQIDDRHGSIHVLPLDFNQDGHLDFIALIGQEHECIEVFINDGNAIFTAHRLWAADNPAYGSSGIELVDFDADNDIDILYINGDSFDRGAKPHHRVQWLENEGEFSFKHHPLCTLPGVMAAKAGDFDGDGDMDVVAASLLVGDSQKQMDAVDASSIVLLIQESKGKFRPTQIEAKLHQHLALETGDFDADGKLDFATGNFLRNNNGPSPTLLLRLNRQ